MQKLSKYMLLCGVIIGLFLGSAMTYAALQHNPQNEFTDSPQNLFLVFGLWAVAGCLPFALIASLIEIYKRLSRKT